MEIEPSVNQKGVKLVGGEAESLAMGKNYLTIFTDGASVLHAGEVSNPVDTVLTDLEFNK